MSKLNTPEATTQDEYEMSATWMAIEPPLLPHMTRLQTDDASLQAHPPSFDAAQFDVVLRRQRTRPPHGSGMKSTAVPSRFFSLPNTFEFSGWGTFSRIELDEIDLTKGEEDVDGSHRAATLGQFTASALAGNDVLGGVFYTLPAVVSVAGVFSPISLFVATLILFLWRPIMEELASALPIGGAPYTYLLNVASKTVALVAAALLLLDFAATAVVSAAVAVNYLAGEVTLPFPVIIGSLLVFLIFTLVSLGGVRDSARVALTVLTLHLVTMATLFVASFVAWGHAGNAQIRQNWHNGTQDLAPSAIARQIFNGICIGILGLTGFECVPSYASSIKQGCFPKVLRNLHYPAIVLNVTSMLLVLALVPLDTVLSGANVLSVLAEIAAGRWLRTWIVVDAVIVLCAGVLTGILSACELFERLARDRLLPQLFTRRLPITQAPAYSICAFVTFSYVLYATSGANLDIVSKMFSLVWLVVMALFPFAVLLLKFNRGRLSRDSRTSLSAVFFTMMVVAVVIGGNVAIDPTIVGYAAAYFVVIAALFYGTMKTSGLVHAVLWIYDQSVWLQSAPWTKTWNIKLTNVMRHLRRQPVCVLVKSDEFRFRNSQTNQLMTAPLQINDLFHKLLYVSQNEETSCLKLVHFYDDESGIPSEMEANWKILDEAFPEITVDLILVRGRFTPSNIAALAHRLDIPTTLMFMSCPGPAFAHCVADFGTRIISL